MSDHSHGAGSTLEQQLGALEINFRFNQKQKFGTDFSMEQSNNEHISLILDF